MAEFFQEVESTLSLGSDGLVRGSNKASALSFSTLLDPLRAVETDATLSAASGTVVKETSVNLTASLSMASDELVRARPLSLDGEVSVASGDVTTLPVQVSDLTGELSLGADGLVIGVNSQSGVAFDGTLDTKVVLLHSIPGGVYFTGILEKALGHVLDGSFDLSGELTKLIITSRDGSIDQTADIVKRVELAYSASLSMSDASIVRGTNVLGALDFDGALASASTSDGAFAHEITGTLDSSAILTKESIPLLSAALSFATSRLRSVSSLLSSALTFASDTVKDTVTLLAGSIAATSSGLVRGVINTSVTSFLGSVTWDRVTLQVSLSGSITPAADLLKGRLLSAVLSFAGQLGNGAFTHFITAALSFTNVGAIRGLNLQGGVLFESAPLTLRQLTTQFFNIASQMSFSSGSSVKRIFTRLVSSLGLTSTTLVGDTSLTSTSVGAISISGSLLKRANKRLLGSASLSGSTSSLTSEYSQSVDGSTSFDGSLTAMKQFNRSLFTDLTFSGSTDKMILLSKSGSLVPSSSGLVRGINLQAAISASSTLEGVVPGLFRSLTGSISPSSTTTKRAGKMFSGSLVITSPARALGRFAVGILGLDSTLEAKRVAPISLTGSMAFSGSILKAFVLSVAGSIRPVGAMVRLPRKVFNATVSYFGQAIRGNINVLSLLGAINPAGTVSVQTGLSHFISLLGSVSSVGGIRKAWTHTISGVMSFSSSVTKRAQILKLAVLSYNGGLASIRLGLTSFINGSLSLGGATVRAIEKSLTGSVSFTALMNDSGVRVVDLLGEIGFTSAVSSLRVSVVNLIGSIAIITGVVRKRTILSIGRITSVLSFSNAGAIRGLNLQGAISLVGAMDPLKIIERAFTSLMSFSSTLSTSKAFGRILGGVLGLGSVSVGRSRFTTGSLSPTGVLVPIKVSLFSVSGVSTSSAVVTKRTTKLTVGAVSYTSSVLRRITKVLSGVVTTLSDLVGVSNNNAYSLLIDGALHVSGEVHKRANYMLSTVLSFSSALPKNIRLIVSNTALTFSSTIEGLKSRIYHVSGELTTSSSVVRSSNKVLDASITASSVMTRIISTLVTGSMDPFGAVTGVRVVVLALVSAMTSSSSLIILPNKSLGGSISTEGGITKVIAVIKSGFISLVSPLSTSYPYHLIGLLTLLGELSASLLNLVRSASAKFVDFSPSTPTAVDITYNTASYTDFTYSTPGAEDFTYTQ